MSHDFSNADTQQFSGSLIPKGTLVKGTITIQGGPNTDGEGITDSQSSDSRYLNLDITITEGQYARRHVFTMIGIHGNEKWVNAGRAQIRAILEYGRGASASNMAGYSVNSLLDLNGLPCAIKVGIEKGKDGHEDKNTVICFLSPNPESSTYKDFQALQSGGNAIAQTAQQGQASTANQPAQSPPSTPSGGKPSWL